MYLDNIISSRTGFKYNYTGKYLYDFAVKKLIEMCEKEKEAREAVIKYTRDPNTNPSDNKVQEAKKDVIKYATIVEELSVHVHEFKRAGDREFSLSMGDVVFFGLVANSILTIIKERVKPE